jgi:OmpA-OmpF porin, OOP family
VGFGFAATYDRFRLYLDMSAPLVTTGQSGAVGDYQFSAPSDGLGSTPDSLSDGRLGVDARILGGPRSPFRLGIGAQLLFPTGKRTDYDSDGTWRSMLRILAAGDVGHLTYAGQLGVHIRPLDDAPTPGSPAGSELLFGAAVGSRFRVGKSSAIVVGPEVFGASAFSSLFGSTKTEVEGLFTGRLEGTRDDGPQLRLKVGTGAGLDAQFGAPEWRVLFGIEIFDHRSDRDHDGIMDSKDACPDTPGVKADNPKTNGCRRYPPSSD